MDGYVYIRAPSAVIETALICKLKAFVIHHRVGLGLNSRHINANPCPSPLGHARPSGTHCIYIYTYTVYASENCRRWSKGAAPAIYVDCFRTGKYLAPKGGDI